MSSLYLSAGFVPLKLSWMTGHQYHKHRAGSAIVPYVWDTYDHGKLSSSRAATMSHPMTHRISAGDQALRATNVWPLGTIVAPTAWSADGDPVAL